MAVILFTTPDIYALTKGGRTLYEFTGSGRVITSGSFAVNAINFTGLPVPDGTRFVLRWNGRTEEIVARSAPADINEIPVGDGSEAYVASLLPYFETYFPFREDFAVSLDSIGSSHSLIFEANKPGPAYNFSTAQVTPNVGNIDPRFSGADELLRERYGVYVELHLQKPDTAGAAPADFERIFSSRIDADEQGLARFDAGDLLHANLAADWPVWNFANPSGSPRSHRRYYVAYGEAWGNPVRIGRMSTDEIRHAYLGGADYQHRAGNGFELIRFAGTTPATDRALRLGSASRFVRPDEPQYLTFVNLRPATATALRLRVSLTFDNDSTVVVPSAYADQSLPEGEKITFPVGFAPLDLAAQIPAGRTLREYSAQLFVGTVAQSVAYRFVLNYDYQPYTRYFAYLNSLGCPETLATFGKGSRELNRFYEQAQQPLSAQYELAGGQFVEYDVSVQQQTEVATGFRPEAELLTWTDFYRSPVRFQLLAGVALPVGIVSKSIKQSKDGETLFAHKFEYVPLYRDDFYTADEEIGDVAPPPGFVPGGTVAVSLPTVVQAFDATIPAFIRSLTLSDINKFKVAGARPNPETLGYLNQQAGSLLFRRQDQLVSFLTGIGDKPTNRDQAGLLDVPTVAETLSMALRATFKSLHVPAHLASWTTELEPIHKP